MIHCMPSNNSINFFNTDLCRKTILKRDRCLVAVSKKNSGDENASGAIPAFSMNSGICSNRTEVQSGVRGHRSSVYGFSSICKW